MPEKKNDNPGQSHAQSAGQPSHVGKLLQSGKSIPQSDEAIPQSGERTRQTGEQPPSLKDESEDLSYLDRHVGSAGAFEGTERGGDDDDKEDDFLKYGR